MRKLILQCTIAAGLLGHLSTASGGASEAGQTDMHAGNDGNETETDTVLRGKIMDPASVAPPREARTPYSGAPAGWENFIKDSQPYTFSIFDRLEYGASDDGDSYLWDAQGWIGGDVNKFWWKTEGEGPTSGDAEDTEFQALYNRTIAPFWGIQTGVRYDTKPGPDTAYGVLGLQGLASYWFETDVSLFVSDEGDLSFRGEFEYELLLTQRLILQPRLEFNASASSARQLGLGSGINNTELGLRLRYEIVREFAPYIGVRWEKLYGDTKDLAQRAGAPDSVTSLVLGFRIWF